MDQTEITSPEIIQHEFTAEENAVFSKVYNSMILLSGIFTIFSLIVFYSALVKSDLLVFTRGLTFILFALVLFFPTDNFKKIIETEGNDIAELMRGVKELGNGFFLMNIVLAFNRILIVLSIFLSL